MNTFEPVDRVQSVNAVPRGGLSAYELAELHKLQRCGRGLAPPVDQEAMERLSARGYVRHGLGGWRPTVPGLLVLSRR